MTLNELIYAAMALVAAFAFGYGFVHLVRGTPKGYFYAFAVLGFFGFAVGRIFLCFLEIISPGSTDYFNIGSVGIVSGFLCLSFACSSVGMTDRIEVERSKRYKRAVPIVPALYVGGFVLLICRGLRPEQLIIYGLLLISAMPCACFCLRNILAPYPARSYMRCLRPFFAVVLSLCGLAAVNEVLWIYADNAAVDLPATLLLTVLGTAGYIAMPILLEGGTKKWMRM